MPVRPPAGAARPRGRHKVMLASLLLFVILPSIFWGGYLWLRAADQYVSTTAFSVRKEEGPSGINILNGLSAIGGVGGSTSDIDILFDVIRSPDMVQRIDRKLNVRAAFSRPWPRDWIFGFDPSGVDEDLAKYWRRQVHVLLDTTTGIITVRTAAFTPEDALAITQEVLREGEEVVNQLSDAARKDAMRMSEEEVARTQKQLLDARQAMTAYRVRTRIVDPVADIGAQMSILSELQNQLVQQQVALDQLRRNSREADPRIRQAEQKIEVLNAQIEEQRTRFGGASSDTNFAQIVAEYEKLKAELEFAEASEKTARVAYEAALTNAQRQSRFLAAHIPPTLAQKSELPDRPWLFGMGVFALSVLWALAMIVFYGIRDRR